jgi:hypothetical protein
MAKIYSLGCGAIIRAGYALLSTENTIHLQRIREGQDIPDDITLYVATDTSE